MPEQHGKFAKVWQAVWISVDADGTVASTTPITLHKEEMGPKGRWKGITFGGFFRAWGRWWYHYDDEASLLLIEFAAGSGYKRRHVMKQLTDDMFELLDATHPAYSTDDWWSSDSRNHTNNTSVYMQTWRHPRFKDG